MKLINVAAGVLNQTPLDWQNNSANIVTAIQQAREENVSILCLPELCISGYGCEDEFHSTGVRQSAEKVLLDLLPHTKDLIVSFGVPLMYAGGIFNCAALAVDGKLVGFVAKQHLAGDGIHYEPRWFKAWPGGIHGGSKSVVRSIRLEILSSTLGEFESVLRFAKTPGLEHGPAEVWQLAEPTSF